MSTEAAPVVGRTAHAVATLRHQPSLDRAESQLPRGQMMLEPSGNGRPVFAGCE